MVYNKTKRKLRRRRVKRRRAIRRTKRRIKSRRRVIKRMRKRTRRRRGGFNKKNFSLSEIGGAPFSKEIMEKLY